MLLAAGVLLATVGTATAQVKLPAVISNNMVLQRDLKLPIWGTAAAGEKVTVEFNGAKETATADASGKWKVLLPPQKAGGPFDMRIVGSNELVLTNILVGEVWVASGQSNMEWTVRISGDAEKEIAAANHPQIRLFQVPKLTAGSPQTDVVAQWKVCSPETIPDFSAVAYNFGREIHTEVGVPVGLINTSWGGSRIEPWTPVEGFAAIPELSQVFDLVKESWKQYAGSVTAYQALQNKWLADSVAAVAAGHNALPAPVAPAHPLNEYGKPTSMYNAMVHGIVPFGIRGALWYQGESNRGEGMLYHHKMRGLIAGWRTMWGQGDFPFLYVQLAPYRYGSNFTALPEIWEAQTATLKVPNTGMAVTTDIATINDIHPPNKRDVGQRLARWALVDTYAKTGIVKSGPLYDSMTVEGNKIRIKFKFGAGLKTAESAAVTWFSVAGADKKFVSATATIDGETIVVTAPGVSAPVAVRFGWHELAEPNLFNAAGLPASPFRTDDWTDAENVPFTSK